LKLLGKGVGETIFEKMVSLGKRKMYKLTNEKRKKALFSSPAKSY